MSLGQWSECWKLTVFKVVYGFLLEVLEDVWTKSFLETVAVEAEKAFRLR